MLEQYKSVCYKLSKTITRDYSTSFSLGIRMLGKRHHASIYAIYGFVRLADEIVDTFHGFDKEKLLHEFIEDTNKALEDRISTNPILHAFQDVVHKFNIDKKLIDAFLHSMEMDLSERTYDDTCYNEYIYGSAEVVGLMCLKVFCDGDQKRYESLLEPARKLGAAFQKVNFLRDIKSDFTERGRVYFPGVDFNRFTAEDKLIIEQDIRKDFDEAYEGIKRLPDGSRLGVTVAYIYYTRLFKKICLLPAQKIQHERIRIPDGQKILLLVNTWCKYHLRLI